MSNIDTSFNRERLIGLFLRANNLLIDVGILNFDDHFFFEDPIDLGSSTPVYYADSPNNSLEVDFKNTQIYVKAKLASPYFGRKKLFYNRISGGDLPPIYVEVVDEVTVYEVIDKINEKYGLFLTQFDIDDGPIVDTGNVLIDLVFKPTSLIFNDHTTINLTIQGGDAATVHGVDDTVGGEGAALTE